jgi:hypothetical protein
MGAPANAATTTAAVTGATAARTAGITARGPIAELRRYWNGKRHWSTTGQAPGGKYRLEGKVGILATRQPGSVPLYGCMAGYTQLDQFLSFDRDCEGEENSFLRREGFIYSSPRSGFTQAIYRCYWPASQSHFYSIEADCESTPTTHVTNEGRLGYAAG